MLDQSYTNTFVLNVEAASNVLLSVKGIVQYGNNALHGFGAMTFSTDLEQFRYTNYGTYLAEWTATFDVPGAAVDVFEVTSGGRIDGQPIMALLPPGSG